MLSRLLVLLVASASADFEVPADQSGDGKAVHVKTNSDPFLWQTGQDTPVKHPLYRNTTTTVYYSHPVEIQKGGAIFTLPVVTTIPMPDPGVPFAIVEMHYDIVDENKQSVPLSELYMHHWLVYDTLTEGTGWNIGCGGEHTFVSNIYGAGAEMRGLRYAYPPGYGYVSKAGLQWWSANLHFIRTEDLNTDYYNGSHGAAVKACIECEYAPNKSASCRPGLDGTGIFGCCEHSSRCPVNNPSDISTKKYSLVQKLTWTTDVANVKPVRTAVIDGFECGTVSNLYAQKKFKGTVCDDKYCKTEVTRPAPFGGTILWGYDHQHVGAVNGSLSVNGDYKCTSHPHVGTDPHDVPGNSLGYVTGFSACIDPAKYPSSAVTIKKGDNLTVTAYYSIDPTDNTSFPLPGGQHTGTMHLFYMYIAEDTPDSYLCKNNQCIAGLGGVPLKTCQAACGGNFVV